MAQPTKPTKRIGRPTKAPKEGERVPLGLRITPRMKRRLEEAATKNGRSLSQETEFRLEMSLSADVQLILAYGGKWLPIIRASGELLIALPISWDDELGEEDDLLPMKIAEEDLKRIRNFFTGAPSPYDLSSREYDAMIEAAEDRYHQERGIRRGNK